MQYEKVNIQDDLHVIIDPYEVKNIMNSIREGKKMKVKKLKKEDVRLKVVYGAIIPQVESTIEEVDEEVEKAIGKALGHVINGQCVLLELTDIILAEEPLDNGYIPFTALINTDLLIDKNSLNSISAFLKYSNLCVEDNIVNRACIFAINRQEERMKIILSEYNWKTMIDMERMYRIAKVIK